MNTIKHHNLLLFERVTELGLNTLTTYELISLISRENIGDSCTLVEQLKSEYGDVYEALRHLSEAELSQHKGFSKEAGTSLLSSLELGKRVWLYKPDITQPIIDRPEAVAQLLKADMAYSENERFAVILLNIKNRLINHQIISVGTLDETIAHPRDVFRQAIRVNAAGIIVAHNHPSGSTSPSNEDYRLTEQLIICGKTLQIPVLDHVIVGGTEYTSLRRTTDLWNR
jgi:DNA repair protein RadC